MARSFSQSSDQQSLHHQCLTATKAVSARLSGRSALIGLRHIRDQLEIMIVSNDESLTADQCAGLRAQRSLLNARLTSSGLLPADLESIGEALSCIHKVGAWRSKRAARAALVTMRAALIELIEDVEDSLAEQRAVWLAMEQNNRPGYSSSAGNPSGYYEDQFLRESDPAAFAAEVNRRHERSAELVAAARQPFIAKREMKRRQRATDRNQVSEQLQFDKPLTEQECSIISRGARMALAARACRYAQLVLGATFDGTSYLDEVDRWIGEAETASELESTVDLSRAIQDLRRFAKDQESWCAAFQDYMNYGNDNAHALGDRAFAASRAAAAIADGLDAATSGTRSACSAAIASVWSADYPRAKLLRADFDVLLDAMRRGQWNDQSSVPKSVLPPIALHAVH